MISAIILTKNEEDNIEECLKSISWCDEKIVIDDGSTDRTVEIAKSMGARVVEAQGDFSARRNLGLKKAKEPWVLFLDADERLSSALWYEITTRINDPIENFSGFYLKRRDIIWENEFKYGETGNVKLLRLAKRDAGAWEGKVHEIWKVKGKIEILNNPIIHYPHPTVAEFLEEINYYTDLRANELFEKKIQVNGFSIVFYPASKFVVNYFFKAGFLDGLPGLVLALMMSFHSFLVRGKLWTLWNKDALYRSTN